jgi:hypothetical protein
LLRNRFLGDGFHRFGARRLRAQLRGEQGRETLRKLPHHAPAGIGDHCLFELTRLSGEINLCHQHDARRIAELAQSGDDPRCR